MTIYDRNNETPEPPMWPIILFFAILLVVGCLLVGGLP